MVWAGGQGIVAAGTQVAVQLPDIWAASEAVFSHDLSVPDLALSCGVECAEAGRSHWEMNHCILLNILTIATTVLPRSQLRPPRLSA